MGASLQFREHQLDVVLVSKTRSAVLREAFLNPDQRLWAEFELGIVRDAASHSSGSSSRYTSP